MSLPVWLYLLAGAGPVLAIALTVLVDWAARQPEVVVVRDER